MSEYAQRAYRNTRGRLERARVRMWLWAGRKLPAKLKYWVMIDVIAKMTTGEYGDTVVPEVTAVEILSRYGKASGAERTGT